MNRLSRQIYLANTNPNNSIFISEKPGKFNKVRILNLCTCQCTYNCLAVMFEALHVFKKKFSLWIQVFPLGVNLLLIFTMHKQPCKTFGYFLSFLAKQRSRDSPSKSTAHMNISTHHHISNTFSIGVHWQIQNGVKSWGWNPNIMSVVCAFSPENHFLKVLEYQ